jgi:hypothetical protein
MDIVAWIWGGTAVALLIAFISVVAVDIWRGRKRWVRCRDCRHCGVNYVTGLHGQGLYQFGTCDRLLHKLKVVDPLAYRRCWYFEKRPTGKEVQDGD